MAEREFNAGVGDESPPVVLEYGRRAPLLETVSVFAVLAGIFAIGALVCAALSHNDQAKVIGVALGVLSALFSGKAAFETGRPITPGRKALLAIIALTGLAGSVANVIAGSGRVTDRGYSIIFCGSQMRATGQQLYLFAYEHSGKFPTSLSQLKELPNQFDASHVVYLGDGLSNSSPANLVLMYEDPDVHSGRGIHVLYVDARVVWVEKGDIQPVMQAITVQTAKIAKPPQ